MHALASSTCQHVEAPGTETFKGRRKRRTERLRVGSWKPHAFGTESLRAGGFRGTNADSEAPGQLGSPGKSERLLREEL